MLLMESMGCGSKLYATFKNGLCYEFISGDCLRQVSRKGVFFSPSPRMIRLSDCTKNNPFLFTYFLPLGSVAHSGNIRQDSTDGGQDAFYQAVRKVFLINFPSVQTFFLSINLIKNQFDQETKEKFFCE